MPGPIDKSTSNPHHEAIDTGADSRADEGNGAERHEGLAPAPGDVFRLDPATNVVPLPRANTALAPAARFAADAPVIELRPSRTPTAPLLAPTYDYSPWLVPALWQQIFRDVPDSRPAKLDAAAQPVGRFVDNHYKMLQKHMQLLDYVGAVDQISQSESPDVRSAYEAVFSNSRTGVDNHLTRVLEGLAVAKIFNESKEVGRGDSLDLDMAYPPVWYALNAGKKAAEQMGAGVVAVFFEAALKDLADRYKNTFKKDPPKIYSSKNWNALDGLPRAKILNAYQKNAGDAQRAYVQRITQTLPETMPVQPLPDAVNQAAAVRAGLTNEEVRQIFSVVYSAGTRFGHSKKDLSELALDLVAARSAERSGDPEAISRSKALLLKFVVVFLARARMVYGELGEAIQSGDPTLSRFNRSLTEQSGKILKLSGWHGHIDEASLENLANAIVKAKQEDRLLILASTHASWADITVIGDLMDGRGVRFAFDRGLYRIPYLGGILREGDMDVMSRYKPKGDWHSDGIGQAINYAELDAIPKRRRADGALSTIFSAGTRDRTGGTGVAKKGTAVLAVEQDALVLPVDLFGTGSILHADAKQMVKRGIGYGYGIYPQIAPVIDGRALNGVSAITNRLEAEQRRLRFLTLDELRKTAAGKGVAAENARRQITEHLAEYRKPYEFLTRNDEKGFLDWCASKKQRTSPEYVRTLLNWATQPELQQALGKVAAPFLGDLGEINSLRPLATPLSATVPNWQRLRLNHLLGGYAPAFFWILREDDWNLRQWAEARPSVSVEAVRAAYESVSPEERASLFNRSETKIQPTWQAMREPWQGGTKWLERAGKRQVFGKLKDYALRRAKPALGSPQEAFSKIVVHGDSEQSMDFNGLQRAHAAVHKADYERVGQLLQDQLALHSPEFLDKWESVTTKLEGALAPLKELTRKYMDGYGQDADKPDYAPVKAAEDAYHRAIVESPLFPEVDPDLRVFAWYVLEAREAFQSAVASGDRAQIEKSRKRYYYLAARGSRYRVLNEINTVLKPDPLEYDRKDVARAVVSRSKIRSLRELGEKIELVGELLAEGVSLSSRAELVAKKISELEAQIKTKYPDAQLKKGDGESAKGWAVRLIFRKLKQEFKEYDPLQLKDALRQQRYLAELTKAHGDAPLEDVFTALLGDRYPLIRNESVAAALAESPALQEAKTSHAGAKLNWEAASTRDLKKWGAHRLKIYEADMRTEYETHGQEGSLQAARYFDLMRTLRASRTLTAGQEAQFAEALADYERLFQAYLDLSKNLSDFEGGKTKENKRKEAELNLFFAWLKLHWSVTDAYQQTGHENAGRIHLFSVMFPNQVEFLNRLSSQEMEGLKPMLKAMNAEMLFSLYCEAKLGGMDPRKMQRVLATWGLQSTNLGVDSLHVHGAGQLLGGRAVPQGDQLLAVGAQTFLDNQTPYGVNPNAMVLDANHMGFGDYPMYANISAFFANLWVVFEATNFAPYPILGTALHGNSPFEFQRDKQGSLQGVMSRGINKGESAIGFGHATRRMATTVNPAIEDALGFLIPREYVYGGNIAEMGAAARDAGTPLVPTYQNVPSNKEPDIPLSGKKDHKGAYSIHAGANLGGEATLSFGKAIPGGILPSDWNDLNGFNIQTPDNATDSGGRRARQFIAAQIEVGRYNAMADALHRSANLTLPPPPPKVTSISEGAVKGGAWRLLRRRSASPRPRASLNFRAPHMRLRHHQPNNGPRIRAAVAHRARAANMANLVRVSTMMRSPAMTASRFLRAGR